MEITKKRKEKILNSKANSSILYKKISQSKSIRIQKPFSSSNSKKIPKRGSDELVNSQQLEVPPVMVLNNIIEEKNQNHDFEYPQFFNPLNKIPSKSNTP